jgi:hypothetical protein
MQEYSRNKASKINNKRWAEKKSKESYCLDVIVSAENLLQLLAAGAPFGHIQLATADLESKSRLARRYAFPK